MSTSKEQFDTTIANWRRRRIRWGIIGECFAALVIVALIGCIILSL